MQNGKSKDVERKKASKNKTGIVAIKEVNMKANSIAGVLACVLAYKDVRKQASTKQKASRIQQRSKQESNKAIKEMEKNS